MVGLTFWDLAYHMLPLWVFKALGWWCFGVVILAPLFGGWAPGTHLASRRDKD